MANSYNLKFKNIDQYQILIYTTLGLLFSALLYDFITALAYTNFLDNKNARDVFFVFSIAFIFILFILYIFNPKDEQAF